MKGWPRLPSPEFELDPENKPRSNRFNDGYASPAGAAAETETVFLGGIGAPEVWLDRPDFSIGETGFGLGLNFLMTWAAWRRTAAPDARLHYVSVEGYPLGRAMLARALDLYRDVDGLPPLIDALCRDFPIRHAGFHRLTLEDGRVQLTLLMGPADRMLSQLSGKMDAWYLDGFAPSRNPDMWSAEIFRAIAERTRPGGRIATYTAAGHVRRGLEAAGFEMQKRPGYAHKRERLTGTLAKPPEAARPEAPWFRLPDIPSDPGEVAIVGGGIAASCCWHALLARGVKARLFDRDDDKGGMGGNPAAMVAPKLPVGASPAGRLNALAFLSALSFYDRLGQNVWHPPRGLLQAAEDDVEADRQSRLSVALAWPEEILKHEQVGGAPALCFPAAGCLDPQAVHRAIGAPVEPADIGWIEPIDGGWRLMDVADREVWSGRTVIAAAGGWTGRLLNMPSLGIRPSRGQVSWIREANLQAAPSKRGVSFSGGYLTPTFDLPGHGRGRVLGSSFDAWRDPDGDTTWKLWSQKDHDSYAANFAERFVAPPPQAEAGWTGLRAMTSDRLPIAGPVPDVNAYREAYPDLHHGKHWFHYPPARYRDGLYVLSGLGARGYQYAPLLGTLLADMIAGTPLPIETDLVEAVHPARFLVRDLKRAGSQAEQATS